MTDPLIDLDRLKEKTRSKRQFWPDADPLKVETHRFEKDSMGRDIAVPVGGDREEFHARWVAKIEYAGMTGVILPVKESMARLQRTAMDSLTGHRWNALLYGPTGTGKTSLALLALRHHHMQGLDVMVRRWPAVKRSMEPPGQETAGLSEGALLERYTQPSLLLLDELGYGNVGRMASDHEHRVLLELLSLREGHAKGTWVTTNMSLEQLADVYGDPTVSRLLRGAVKFETKPLPNFRLS